MPLVFVCRERWYFQDAPEQVGTFLRELSYSDTDFVTPQDTYSTQKSTKYTVGIRRQLNSLTFLYETSITARMCIGLKTSLVNFRL